MMESVSKGDIVEIIARYNTGEASQKDLEELQRWLDESADNKSYFQQLSNIWNNSRQYSFKNTLDTAKAYNKVNRRISPGASSFSLWSAWKQIAAILLIPVILSNLLYFILRSTTDPIPTQPVYNELFAAFGTRSALKLSDGTSVWLNSGSSIKYPDKFTGDDRTVFLNGEAYFEVVSNAAKPFIVNTSSITVKATGTKFNVLGYSAINEDEVTLVSGKVEVGLAAGKNNGESTKLEVNQHLTFSKNTGAVRIVNEDTYKYISWKEGKLIFRNEPMKDVVKKIGQVFNIDIEIRGKELENYSYRATFEDESLSEILKLLKLSSPIDYYEVRRNPLPDGSFPKKKVIIYPAGQKQLMKPV
jgi:transmembrane sensor